jgi:L-ribulose-5-phosphate 3-epimerase UlaE
MRKILIDSALIAVGRTLKKVVTENSAAQCVSWRTTLILLKELGFTRVSISIDMYNEMKK